MNSTLWPLRLKAGVAVKPELKRNVEDLRLDAAGGVAGLGNLSQFGGVANHVGVAELMASGLGQLVPDVEPITVVLVTIEPRLSARV